MGSFDLLAAIVVSFATRQRTPTSRWAAHRMLTHDKEFSIRMRSVDPYSCANKSRQFVPYLNGISAIDSRVSPDGKWILYVAYPNRTLWRSRSDGSEPVQIKIIHFTKGNDYATVSTWLPLPISFLRFMH